MKIFILLFVSFSLLNDPVFADSKRNAFMKYCMVDNNTTSKSTQRKICKCAYAEIQSGLDVTSAAYLCTMKYPN